MYTSIATWTKFLLTFHKSFEKTKNNALFLNCTYSSSTLHTVTASWHRVQKQGSKWSNLFLFLSFSVSQHEYIIVFWDGKWIAVWIHHRLYHWEQEQKTVTLESIMPLLLFWNNGSNPQVLTNSLGKKKTTIIQSKLL